jgi:hypothetical protein
MTSILSTAIAEDVASAAMRQAIYSANYGGDLYVVGKRYSAFATTDEVSRGAVRPEVVTLSADGRQWIDGWHSGEESGEAVYVEKITLGGSSFHGYVDKESRRVVQAG